MKLLAILIAVTLLPFSSSTLFAAQTKVSDFPPSFRGFWSYERNCRDLRDHALNGLFFKKREINLSKSSGKLLSAKQNGRRLTANIAWTDDQDGSTYTEVITFTIAANGATMSYSIAGGSSNVVYDC